METDLTRAVRDAITSEVTPVLLKMLCESESRIDETNKMVQKLADTCSKNIEMFDKHLLTLEESRSLAQSNSSKNLEVCKSLTSLLDEYRSELKAMREDYRRLSEAYTRLAESSKMQSRSSVKVNI